MLDSEKLYQFWIQGRPEDRSGTLGTVLTVFVFYRYSIRSRRTIMRSMLPAEYEAAKAKLLNTVSTLTSCSLTTDFWTSSSSESYGHLPFCDFHLGAAVACPCHLSG